MIHSKHKHEDTISPYVAAGPGLDPGWLDAVIDPLDTRIPLWRDRLWISMGSRRRRRALPLGSSIWGFFRLEQRGLRYAYDENSDGHGGATGSVAGVRPAA
jgi:hypothetical protein